MSRAETAERGVDLNKFLHLPGTTFDRLTTTLKQAE
jgi:hypothetical protein